jgi:hypothetical protein
MQEYSYAGNQICLCTAQLESCSLMPLHCWPPNRHLVTQCLQAYPSSTACLAWFVILEIQIHFAVLWNMVLNINYSYIALFNILPRGNTVQSSIGSILTVQSPMESNDSHITKLCPLGSDWTKRPPQKKKLFSGCSVCFGKECSSHYRDG